MAPVPASLAYSPIDKIYYVLHTNVIVSTQIQSDAVTTIRSWYALDQALRAAGKSMTHHFGVTGAQVAILRIVAEREKWALTDLKQRLAMHPATLGQHLDRLSAKRLIHAGKDPEDGRRKIVAATPHGRHLISTIPLIGPVRLRSAPIPEEDLAAMTRGFELAFTHFGLTEDLPAQKSPTSTANFVQKDAL